MQPPRVVGFPRRPPADARLPGRPGPGPGCGVRQPVPDRQAWRREFTEDDEGGEFTEDDEAVLIALGSAAGVAVENARLYEAARRQQRWIQASAEVTTRLLSGSEPADITRRALEHR
jgi:GAF domain-containing protein